jgi:lipoprotein-releasing system ATP-binding protein
MNEKIDGNTVLECTALHRTFSQGPEDVTVLRGVTFSVTAGEQVAIIGSSGSGKSTLLHLLGGLDEPTSGTVTVDGKNINTLNQAERGQLRNRSLCLPVSPPVTGVHSTGKCCNASAYTPFR